MRAVISMGPLAKVSLLSLAFSFFVLGFVSGQIVNGGFETGSFPPWTTTGTAAVSGSALPAPPAEGNFQAVISTPPGAGTVSQSTMETFLELNAGTLNSLKGPGTGFFAGGSAIKQIFTVQNGDVITFSWDFFPNGSNLSTSQNDSAFFTLHLSGSSSSSFTILDTTIISGGSESGYQLFSTGPLTAGTYLLGFAAFDVNNGGQAPADVQDPTLLIDNVQIIPEPAIWTFLSGGGVIGFLLLRRRRFTLG
jgi:hypothetical protein